MPHRKRLALQQRTVSKKSRKKKAQKMLAARPCWRKYQLQLWLCIVDFHILSTYFQVSIAPIKFMICNLFFSSGRSAAFLNLILICHIFFITSVTPQFFLYFFIFHYNLLVPIIVMQDILKNETEDAISLIIDFTRSVCPLFLLWTNYSLPVSPLLDQVT